MNTIELNAIAKEFETPTFLFDTEALRKRMGSIKEIVGEKAKQRVQQQKVELKHLKLIILIQMKELI